MALVFIRVAGELESNPPDIGTRSQSIIEHIWTKSTDSCPWKIYYLHLDTGMYDFTLRDDVRVP